MTNLPLDFVTAAWASFLSTFNAMSGDADILCRYFEGSFEMTKPAGPELQFLQCLNGAACAVYYRYLAEAGQIDECLATYSRRRRAV